MDTKLKNRHKLGILLIFCVVISAAFLMVSAFPMIEKEADKLAGNNQSVYDENRVENICVQMLHWPYALWMQEQEEEAEKVLTPSQVLAPGLLEKTSSYAAAETEPAEAIWENQNSIDGTNVVEITENTDAQNQNAGADGEGAGEKEIENPAENILGAAAGNEAQNRTENGLENDIENRLENNTEDGLENNIESGLGNNTEDGLGNNTEDGLENNTESGPENNTESGPENNTEDGLENNTESGLGSGTGDAVKKDMENSEDWEEQEYLIQIRLEQMEESRAAEAERMALLQELRRNVDNAGRMWQTNLREWQNDMQYRVLDEQGQVVRSGGENIADAGGEWMRVRMHYGEQGVLDGVYLETSEQEWKDINKTEVVRMFEKNLTEYYYKDILREYFCSEEIYGKTYDEIQFSGPKNGTFEFTIPADRIFDDAGTIYYRRWHYMENGVCIVVLLMLAIYVTLAAILLPCIPSLQLGKGKISHLPFELVVAELGMTSVLGYIYGTAFFLYIANGNLPSMIAEVTGLTTQNAYWAAMAMCMLYWILVFAFGYWGVHCFREIFRIGLKRYLKERTIIGSSLCWCFRKWLKVYHAFREVDLEKKSTKTIIKIVLANFVVLSIISCFWMFGILFLAVYSVVVFLLLTRYWNKVHEKYEILLKAVKQMAEGKLDTEISENLGIFESLKEELQKVQKGFKTAVEEETRSQRMKTELITNVSHDLKTPLTAIVTYVNLLKQENITEEEKNSYIEILDKKSMRLKTLIEDLFEVSKAASRTVKLNLVEVDIVSLLKQVRLELSDKLEQSGVAFRWDFPDEKVIVLLDSDKTYRIFENLLVNIAKYAMPGTRAYIEVGEEILSEEKEEPILKMESAKPRNMETIESTQSRKSMRNRKGKQNMENIQNAQSKQTVENIQNAEGKQTAENIQSAEGIQTVENIQSAESTQSRESIQNAQSTPNMEGIEYMEDIERMENMEDIEHMGNMENGKMEEAETKNVDTLTAENFKKFLNPVKKRKKVWVSMKNISSTEIRVNPEELTERFVRGDESRNTEGSGLGLAIAKNLVEAQNGTMDVDVEADLFKVRIEWKC